MSYVLRAVVLAAAVAVVPAAHAMTDAQIAAKARSAMLFVEVKGKPGKPGSGVIISPRGDALTACHVAEPGDQVTVRIERRYGEPISNVHVVECLKAADVARMELPPRKGGYPYLQMGNPLKLARMDRLFLAGFPLGLEGSVAPGTFDHRKGPNNMWQIRVQGSPGNSGGPVVNERAEMVGLFGYAYADSEQLDQMVPNTLFADFLDEAQVSYPYQAVAAPVASTGVSPVVKAALAIADMTAERAKGVADNADRRRAEANGWAKAGTEARGRALNQWGGYAQINMMGQIGPMMYLGAVTRNGRGAILAHGAGVRQQPGGYYSGQFLWNSVAGSGTFVDQQNRRLAGLWGHGQFRFGVSQPDPQRPECRHLGSFVGTRDGYRLNGFGGMENVKVQGSAVRRLYGEFEHGELNGFGVMEFPDGTQWKGEWKHNRLNGVGAKFRKGSTTPYEQGFYVDGAHRSDA